MSAVITAPFGNAEAIWQAAAANAARRRAKQLGYSPEAAARFARQARIEASDWEPAEVTAARIVYPQRARFAGHSGGAA